jgi:hypothetical protein
MFLVPSGAGEGNRTLMTSLEGVQRTAVTAAGLVDPLPGSDPCCPLLTLVNGPLMARHPYADLIGETVLAAPTIDLYRTVRGQADLARKER